VNKVERKRNLRKMWDSGSHDFELASNLSSYQSQLGLDITDEMSGKDSFVSSPFVMSPFVMRRKNASAPSSPGAAPKKDKTPAAESDAKVSVEEWVQEDNSKRRKKRLSGAGWVNVADDASVDSSRARSFLDLTEADAKLEAEAASEAASASSTSSSISSDATPTPGATPTPLSEEPPAVPAIRMNLFPMVREKLEVARKAAKQLMHDPTRTEKEKDDIAQQYAYTCIVTLRQLRHHCMESKLDGWRGTILRKMLIVDDSLVTRKLISRAFVNANFIVDVACDGQEGERYGGWGGLMHGSVMIYEVRVGGSLMRPAGSAGLGYASGSRCC